MKGERRDEKPVRDDRRRPRVRGRHRLKGGRERQDPDLWRGGARSRRPARGREPARRPRPRTRSRTMSPIRLTSAQSPAATPTGSPTVASSSTASLTSSTESPATSTRCTAGPHGFGKRIWTLGEPRRFVRDPEARVAGRRRRLPGRARRNLRLSDARAGDASRRTDRDRRQADCRQPHPPRLFQSRRFARHPRSRGDAVCRLLSHRRTPISFRPARSGRVAGGAYDFRERAAGAQRERDGLRHEFRRSAPARPRRAWLRSRTSARQGTG